MNFTPGQRIGVLSVKVQNKVTGPPPAYNDASLIEAMTKIHLTVEDPELKEVLSKTNGLGTERTRHEFIEKNIKDEYLVREKNGELHATEKARVIMPFLSKSIKDPILTAKWEAGLRAVAAGELSPDQFKSSQISFVKKSIEAALSCKIESNVLKRFDAPKKPIEKLEKDGSKCPKCSDGILLTRTSKKDNKRFLGCSNFPKGTCKHIEN